MNPTDFLEVSVDTNILSRLKNQSWWSKHIRQSKVGSVPIVREVVNYDGIINVCITADIYVKDIHKGIACFLGHDLTPEDCGITNKS